MDPIGTVAGLWRFPVKSMGGEQLEVAELTPEGFVGDRLWAVRDPRGSILSAKKVPALLLCRARFLEQPAAGAVGREVPPVAITLPDGAEVRSDQSDVDARLSAQLGRPVTLAPRQPAADRGHYRAAPLTLEEMRKEFGIGPGEPLPDFSMMPVAKLAQLARYATPPGTYFDAYPLHVLTTSSVAAMQARAAGPLFEVARFRPNLLVRTEGEGLLEGRWCGGTLQAGETAAAVEVPTVRCSMPTHAQPGVAADPAVLRALVQHASRCLGVYARPVRAGKVRAGDPVSVETPEPSALGRWAEAGARSLKRAALRLAAKLTPEK